MSYFFILTIFFKFGVSQSD